MSKQSRPSFQKSIALGALLLLAATASGCGLGLPTQPDIDAGVVHERGAGAAGVQESDVSLELGDPGQSVGGSDSSDAPDGEIVIPTAGPRAGLGGWAHGHDKRKNRS